MLPNRMPHSIITTAARRGPMIWTTQPAIVNRSGPSSKVSNKNTASSPSPKIILSRNKDPTVLDKGHVIGVQHRACP